ncbi:acetyl-CoA synthetase [Bordetella trematum]|nr:acetyl-CoA synthetase [Bordetella trematum]
MTDRPFSVSHLGALADHWPAQRPALIALDDTGQPTVWRYGELRAQACRLGSALLARGLPPGAAVAILAANSADYVVALLGLARAGLVAVPLNIKFPTQTQAEVLADSGAVLVLHDTAQCPPGALPAIAFGSSAWHALLAEGKPRLRPRPWPAWPCCCTPRARPDAPRACA